MRNNRSACRIPFVLHGYVNCWHGDSHLCCSCCYHLSRRFYCCPCLQHLHSFYWLFRIFNLLVRNKQIIDSPFRSVKKILVQLEKRVNEIRGTNEKWSQKLIDHFQRFWRYSQVSSSLFGIGRREKLMTVDYFADAGIKDKVHQPDVGWESEKSPFRYGWALTSSSTQKPRHVSTVLMGRRNGFS